MQQVQEKQPMKVIKEQPKNEQPEFQQSAWPTVLSVASKACYSAAGASMLLSIGVWNRHNIKTPKLSAPQIRLPRLGKKPAKKSAIAMVTEKLPEVKMPAVKLPNLKAGRPAPRHHEAERLGMFVGLWVPTLVVAGKVLDDASRHVAKTEMEQWEQDHAATQKPTSDLRTRFFSR